MPDSFEKTIALERVTDNEHRLVFPDGWQQGRGAFGGLVLGALMEGMAAAEPDPVRTARAFSGDLCGPALPVETRIISRVLRRGNNQTNVSATLEQAGAVVAHGSCILAVPRKIRTPPHLTMEPPVRIPYDECRIAPVRAPLGPRFAEHYEYRPVVGLPFSSSPEALVAGWVKEQIPLSRMTAAALLGRLDAYWPGVFAVESEPRPIATVSFLAEILCDPATLDPLLPLFYRARVVAQGGGYFVELRELWNGDTPVALNQQSLAMLG